MKVSELGIVLIRLIFRIKKWFMMKQINRSSIFRSLHAKMVDAGFILEKRQPTHFQNRKDSELKFVHPLLVEKWEEHGHSVRAQKFYIKPLSDDENSDIGMVNGKTSPLHSLNIFQTANSIDTHDKAGAWVNRGNDNTLDILLAQIREYVGNSNVFSNEPNNSVALKDAPKKTKTKRNPKWNRDELILVLNCYLEHYPKIPGKKSEEVANLSNLLNALGSKLTGEISATFRNVNGVYMKMMNFHSVNPDHDGKGLKAGGKLGQEIWEEFSGDAKKLKLISRAIKLSIEDPNILPTNKVLKDETEAEAQEGRILTRVHRYRERYSKLVKKKKEKVFAETGKLECECCTFDFVETYGERGKGFIECHHINPVSEIERGRKPS